MGSICFSFHASQWEAPYCISRSHLIFIRGSGEPSKLHWACSTTNAVMWTLVYIARQVISLWAEGLKDTAVWDRERDNNLC